jgi:hypothetical protein
VNPASNAAGGGEEVWLVGSASNAVNPASNAAGGGEEVWLVGSASNAVNPASNAAGGEVDFWKAGNSVGEENGEASSNEGNCGLERASLAAFDSKSGKGLTPNDAAGETPAEVSNASSLNDCSVNDPAVRSMRRRPAADHRERQ